MQLDQWAVTAPMHDGLGAVERRCEIRSQALPHCKLDQPVEIRRYRVVYGSR
jgi:hypothetical protein